MIPLLLAAAVIVDVCTWNVCKAMPTLRQTQDCSQGTGSSEDLAQIIALARESGANVAYDCKPKKETKK